MGKEDVEISHSTEKKMWFSYLEVSTGNGNSEISGSAQDQWLLVSGENVQ